MPNIKNPLLSFGAHGSIGKAITFVRRRGKEIAERFPIPKDVGSIEQLSWRTMYQKCALLWHDLSSAERQVWESTARPLHMTGFAYWQSKCLRPNPGIYLPLAGGTMSGNIVMAGQKVEDLPDPVAAQEPVTKQFFEDNLPAGGYTEGAHVFNSVDIVCPSESWHILSFDSERYDTDSIHDTVTNNSRLTCKTPGKYLIVALAGDTRHSIRLGGAENNIIRTIEIDFEITNSSVMRPETG